MVIFFASNFLAEWSIFMDIVVSASALSVRQGTVVGPLLFRCICIPTSSLIPIIGSDRISSASGHFVLAACIETALWGRN